MSNLVSKIPGLKTKWPLLVVLLLLFVLPQFIPVFYTYLLTSIIIMALAATSLNLQLGYAGIVALGHAAFFGVGAYTVVLLTVKAGFPLPIAMIFGPLLAALTGLFIGYFSLKRSLVYCALLTLAFNVIVYMVASKWSSLTGGDTGTSGVLLPSFISTTTNFYYFTLILALICIALMWMIVNSFFGKVVQSIRENQQRAEFLGFNVKSYLLSVFVMGAFFAGFAGVLFGLFTRSVFPTYAGTTKSLELLLMCALGGTSSFVGPSIGAFIILILSKALSDYIQYWPIGIGILLVVVGTYFHSGIVGIYYEIKRRLGYDS